MSYDWLPFAAGISLFVIQPALDHIWSGAAERYFEHEGAYPNLGRTAFESVLAWITDLAQVIPATFLLLVGAVILGGQNSQPLFYALLLLVFVVVLSCVLVVRKNDEPHVYRKTFWPSDKWCRRLRPLRCFRRSRLQWLLLALNVLGLLVALLLTT